MGIVIPNGLSAGSPAAAEGPGTGVSGMASNGLFATSNACLVSGDTPPVRCGANEISSCTSTRSTPCPRARHTITPRIHQCGNGIGVDRGAYRSGIITALQFAGAQRWLLQTDGAITSCADVDPAPMTSSNPTREAGR